jgi:hypothetical protein
MGSQLCATMNAGEPYYISIALKRTITAFPFEHDAGLKIWGGTASCTETELLWTSSTVTSNTWSIFSGSFTPASNYDYIVLESDCPGGGCSAFSGAYLGVDYLSILSTLPVEYLNLGAERFSNHVEISWITGSEINNSHFELERSLDGVNFEAIAYIKGAGNSSQSLSYSWADEHAPDELHYYRIRQVDFDGKSSYSKTIAVKQTKVPQFISLIENSDRDFFTIRINTAIRQRVYVSLIDVSGKIFYSSIVDLSAGENTISSGFGLPAGAYFLKVMGEHTIENKKIILF